MKDEEMKKTHMVIAALMNPENTIIDNAKIEIMMQNELGELAQKWKEKGWIKRFMIAPDEFVLDAIKSCADKKMEGNEQEVKDYECPECGYAMSWHGPFQFCPICGRKKSNIHKFASLEESLMTIEK